jgi:hypothetical protein
MVSNHPLPSCLAISLTHSFQFTVDTRKVESGPPSFPLELSHTDFQMTPSLDHTTKVPSALKFYSVVPVVLFLAFRGFHFSSALTKYPKVPFSVIPKRYVLP